MKGSDLTGIIIGYWNTRGICEPIRLLLHYVGAPFVDRRYPVGPPPTYDKNAWTEEKHNIGLLIPNLPYFIDTNSGVKLTQTHAILKYLAEVYDLDGQTPQDRAVAVSIMEGIRDWMYDFFDVTYCNAPWATDLDEGVHVLGASQCLRSAPKFERLRGKYLETTLPKHLAIYERILSSNAAAQSAAISCISETLHGGKTTIVWLMGERLTYVDFLMCEYLLQHEVFAPRALESYPFLAAYLAQFKTLPPVAEYMASDGYWQVPMHNIYSHFAAGWV